VRLDLARVVGKLATVTAAGIAPMRDAAE